MELVIGFIFIGAFIKLLRRAGQASRSKPRRASYTPPPVKAAPTTPTKTAAAVEREKRNALKAEQARIDIDYYSSVKAAQETLITALQSELKHEQRRIRDRELAFEMSETNPAESARLFSETIGLDIDKATKRIETLTSRIQAAQGKAATAQKRIKTAEMIIELYGG